MFTNYFIKKKIQALVSDAGGRPRRSLSLDEARSLLVLYNMEAVSYTHLTLPTT